MACLLWERSALTSSELTAGSPSGVKILLMHSQSSSAMDSISVDAPMH